LIQSSLPSTQHFIGPIYYWAEFCIANLHIPDEAGKFEEYLDQEITEKEITLIQSDDWLFFKSQVQPYSPLGEYPSAWESMPLALAIWVLNFFNFLNLCRQ
jgi:hypothetical protein